MPNKALKATRKATLLSSVVRCKTRIMLWINLVIQKWTVRIGGKSTGDRIKVSGRFVVMSDVILEAEEIQVRIISFDSYDICNQSISVNASDLRNGVYTIR